MHALMHSFIMCCSVSKPFMHFMTSLRVLRLVFNSFGTGRHGVHSLGVFQLKLRYYYSQVPISAGPGGRLSVLLKSFSNPSSLDLNGKCCESTCRSCDYYLQVCLKETAPGSCVKSVTTNTYHNTKYVVFKVNEAFASGGQNPIVWTFSSWKVGSFIN